MALYPILPYYVLHVYLPFGSYFKKILRRAILLCLSVSSLSMPCRHACAYTYRREGEEVERRPNDDAAKKKEEGGSSLRPWEGGERGRERQRDARRFRY